MVTKIDKNTINLFSSKKSDEWETPINHFEEWDKEFKFTLDACATKNNAKCDNYITIETNALKVEWKGRIFCNPPYSKIKEFLQKAEIELRKGKVELIVFLTFSNTDTKWFHKYIYHKAELRFIKGRLKFGGVNSKGEKVNNSAMRPSMLCIFRNKNSEE